MDFLCAGGLVQDRGADGFVVSLGYFRPGRCDRVCLIMMVVGISFRTGTCFGGERRIEDCIFRILFMSTASRWNTN